MALYLLVSVIFLQCVGRSVVHGAPRTDPLVDSKVGLIKGTLASDGDYAMFLGIPYAKVDEDNLFGDSIPYPKFENTFQAADDSAICPQIEEFNYTIVGTLDCLHLNVFVPNEATSNNRLPVLVWIHGGGFEYGFYSRYIFGPKFLVRHGVLLVTINYRLGPYGFMCPSIPEVPGNQGLKDQLTALRWIKQNIESFGGDANQITLFGESAGAMSVDLHIYSTAENLFHRAILQSGVSYTSSLISNPGPEGILRLASQLGLVTNNVKEALAFIAKVDTHLVIATADELGLQFLPCIEKTYDNVESFLKEYPVNSNVPKIKEIPIIIGFNSNEGLSFVDFFLETPDTVGSIVNGTFAMDSQTFDEMSKILKHFYVGDKDINEETRPQIMNMISDFMFTYPTHLSLRKYFNNGAKTIFSYMFSYSSERNFVKYKEGITGHGASHADELSYLFDVFYMKSVMSEEEEIAVDRITTLWTNFVKYGDPTPETSELLPVKWTPATEDHWNYLNIDSELTMETSPFNERMAFLDLFFKINEKQQIGYGSTE